MTAQANTRQKAWKQMSNEWRPHSCRWSWETFFLVYFSSFYHRRMRKTDLKLNLPSPSSLLDLTTIKWWKNWRKLFNDSDIISVLTSSSGNKNFHIILVRMLTPELIWAWLYNIQTWARPANLSFSSSFLREDLSFWVASSLEMTLYSRRIRTGAQYFSNNYLHHDFLSKSTPYSSAQDEKRASHMLRCCCVLLEKKRIRWHPDIDGLRFYRTVPLTGPIRFRRAPTFVPLLSV
jgi:hypothetical protein